MKVALDKIAEMATAKAKEEIVAKEDENVFSALTRGIYFSNKFLYITFATNKAAAFSKVKEYDNNLFRYAHMVVDLNDYQVVKNRYGKIQKKFEWR